MYEFWTPWICCQLGAAKSEEIPPPPAPELAPLFQTVSAGGVDPPLVSEVPPAPVTLGWSAGSSTASWVAVFTPGM